MSVTINGTYLPDINLNVKQGSDIPATPSTRDKTLQIPDRDGLIHFGSTMSEMSFTLECRTIRKDVMDVQRTARELNRLLLDDYGRPKELKIVYDYEPDKYYTAKYAGGMPIERRAVAGDLSIPLTAYNPKSKLVVENHEISWDSTELTFESSVSMDTKHTGESIKITGPRKYFYTVNGYAIKPTFIIEGNADALTVAANGQSFSLGPFSNTKYEVIGESYTVKKNNSLNGLPDLSGAFIELLPGDNGLTIEGLNIDIKFSLVFRDQY